MAQVLKDLFGGGKAAETPIPAGDSDFADFAGAPEPAPAANVPVSPTLEGTGAAPTARTYTKWYRIHERHSLSEFKAEGLILGCIAVIVILHLIGSRLNRSKARKWAKAHVAPLAAEFALVGFDSVPAPIADKMGDELIQALADENARRGESILREKSLYEFATYATGRQNVAFVDIKLTLKKRFNPVQTLIETVIGFFSDGFTSEDTAEAILYPFDGLEAATVPGLPGAAELRAKETKSTYDGFVWAIVNKERMKQVREDRFDVSITTTKDNVKLPNWLTVMTESAEITNALLTPELIKAAEAAGELLDYFIVTDQPVDRPKTINESKPRKRIYLKYHLPSNDDYEPLLPIFKYLLQAPDQLVQVAHFRPEVSRKLRQAREETVRQIQKAEEEEKAEERALERERAKKAKRDQELSALDAKAQKKYLEREREKELRKSMKKQTARM
ncbi:hypothetical protein VTK73DRAFT_2597 [Phialemonium thermophilum]|uniref:DUF1682 domain-containing protein n=1 Tax=Phialemonium thermophilum TaxID=223376 RepID=A0ABR3X4A5_9PEZI